MSRTRDIAAILSATEASNTNNVALLNTNSSVGLDSAQVSAIGVTAYDSVGALPVTGLISGDQAFVESAGAAGQSRLYISNGSGWYNVALINATPRLTLSSEGTIALSSDGTATTITMTALDSDHASANLTLSIESGGDLFKFATVSRDSSVVTITPRSEDSATTLGYDGSATLTFKASDGISFGSVVNTFTLTFGPDWSASYTESKVLADNPSSNDYFGTSVAISNDGAYAIVGSISEDTSGSGAGAAYVYVRSGSSWSQQQMLKASDAMANGIFGYSVAMSSDGTYAVVGARYQNANGAAYVYIRSGTSWTQQAKLTASNAGTGDAFGWSVDISNDGTYIIVGAKDEDSTASSSGSAYVFIRSGTSWSEQQKINGSGAIVNGYFGYSASINSDGTYIAIGAYGDNNMDYGAVHVFSRSGTTWSEQQKIVASDQGVSDHLGVSVSISGAGDYVIAGAWGSETGGSNAGAAYIFSRSGTTWSQQQKIQSTDIGANDHFGWSSNISNDGNYVIVGAHYEGTGGGEAGAAYIFNRDGTTWSQVRKLQAADKATSDYFGNSVYLSTDASFAICGSQYETTSPNSAQGAAYIFEAG